MCFRISKDKARQARTRARKTAYKVARVGQDYNLRGERVYHPLYINTGLSYVVGGTYKATPGPWSESASFKQRDTLNGQYVCLTLKRAQKMARRYSGHSPSAIFKVAVKGFRHVSSCGELATFNSVKFLSRVE